VLGGGWGFCHTTEQNLGKLGELWAESSLPAASFNVDAQIATIRRAVDEAPRPWPGGCGAASVSASAGTRPRRKSDTDRRLRKHQADTDTPAGVRLGDRNTVVKHGTPPPTAAHLPG
jgi:hypothetical protein